MLQHPSKFSKLYSKIAEDPRVNVWHIALYICVLHRWEKSGFQKQVKVSRKLLMAGAHFGSITTYHKILGKLVKFGYLRYTPTYDPNQGSEIEVIFEDEMV